MIDELEVVFLHVSKDINIEVDGLKHWDQSFDVNVDFGKRTATLTGNWSNGDLFYLSYYDSGIKLLLTMNRENNLLGVFSNKHLKYDTDSKKIILVESKKELINED